MAKYSFALANGAYKTHPQQLMYDFVRKVVNTLYDVMQDLVNDLPDIAIDEHIYITLPSKISFEIALKVEGSWQIPDFTMPEQTFENDTWEFTIAGFTFDFEVNWPILKFIDLIAPQIANPVISDQNMLWKIGDNYVWGNTIDKYYTLADGLVDGTCIGALFIIAYGLTSFGAHKIQEALSQKTMSTTSFKPTVSIKTVSDNVKTIKSTTDSTAEDMSTVKTDTATIKSDVATTKIDAAASKTHSEAIKNLTAGTNLANKFVQTITYLDDAQKALSALGIDTGAISVLVTSINVAVSDVMLTKEDGGDITEKIETIQGYVKEVKTIVDAVMSKVKYGAYT